MFYDVAAKAGENGGLSETQLNNILYDLPYTEAHSGKKFDNIVEYANQLPIDSKFFGKTMNRIGQINEAIRSQDTVNNDRLVKEIQDAAELSGTLKSKFTTSFTEFSKLGIKGVLQGDLMYTDLDTDTIDGTKYYTFQPNTIVYAVPVDSDLGKQMKASKIGVVWLSLIHI